MANVKSKASDLLVRCLETEGVSHIFGVPGEENADFMMSLKNAERIKFFLTRHEQGAAFMAEAYGRLLGSPAVCLGTLGPGATNLITGVANANMDRVPMLVITGQGSSTRLHKESHQIMDAVGMFRPVTKWAVRIINPDTIPEIVRKAVRIARGEKPGAVHIELPEDIASAETSEVPMQPKRFVRPVPDREMVRLVAETLATKNRPVIIAGNGCVRQQLDGALSGFCDATGVSVISTFMAKGAVDVDSPHCMYTIGLSGRDLPACAIDAADAILTIGYDMVEYPPMLWNADSDKTIIHIDYTPAEIDEHYNPDYELIGDIKQTLLRLTDALADKSIDYDVAPFRHLREEMTKELAETAEEETTGSIKPQKILWETRKLLARDAIVLSDVGAHKMWISRHFHCHEPNTCLIPNGFCSMGSALPGAIAAALVHPQREILAICGDGGYMMNVQEMETATRLGVNITVMVWEDREYGLIAWKQEAAFGDTTDLKFGNPDWAGLSKAFGWRCHKVNDSRDLASTVRAALDESGPSLVVIPVDYRENMKLTQRLGEIVCPI
jgi:acetolactate synthase-1/2/3 large subunit